MCYVAWDKVTTPKGMGGLGLRSLKEMNTPLVLKNVWKVANGGTAPWILVLKAKYFPRSAFWATNRIHNCTKLWRDLVRSKPLIQQHLKWKIGSGERIHLFSEPWFEGWEHFGATNAAQRQLSVSSLIDQSSNNWDFQHLQSTFGFFQALLIAANDQNRPGVSGTPDTLMFTHARDGKFTVKKAYQLVRGDSGIDSDKVFWERVWGEKGLLPKLKTFV